MTDAYCRYIVGDALTVMRNMPDDSVDLVLSSPAFWNLRSYLPSDHADKSREMGSETTPGEYIDALLDVMEECRRVLAPHGSMALELGDSYVGSGGAGGDYNMNGLRAGQPHFKQPRGQQALDKSLALIPESLRWAMVYGRNPFTGRETPRWRVRNVVRHFRPNPPVGSLGDKWRPATSDWVVGCTSGNRFFDLDSVRNGPSPNTHARTARGVESVDRSGKSAERDGNWHSLPELHETAGAPPLDWCVEDDLEWRDAAGIIEPTFPYPGAHYATFSPKLVARFIECMTPRRVCVVCGEPSRRVTKADDGYAELLGSSWADRDNGRPKAAKRERNSHSAQPLGDHDRLTSASYQTVGWTDCGHDAWRTGVVLDMFAGSGTTLAVAQGHGRSALGVDLDPRNAELARQRIGMFLTVEGDEEPRQVTDAPASLLQGGSMEQSLGGRTGDAESSP